RARLVALALEDQALIGPGLGVAAVERDGAVEIGQRVLVVVAGEVGEAAAIIGFGRRRRQRDGGGEILQREIMLAARLIEQAAIVVGAWVGGVELDRPLEILKRLIGAPA